MNSPDAKDWTELAGLVTGVGSLPGQDPELAVSMVATCAPELPFWPQLPGRGAAEGMIGQAFAGLPGIQPDPHGALVRVAERAALLSALQAAPADLTAESASGFFAFEAALDAGAFPQARALKGQLTGPVTLATLLQAEGRSALEDHELCAALARRTARAATWQVERLRRHGLPVLLVLDEPCLGSGGAEASAHLQIAITAIREAGALAGVHSCAEPALATLASAPPDLLSFDAAQHLTGLLAKPGAEAFLRALPLIAWGLVPGTGELPDAEPLVASWREALGPLVTELAARSLVTATCGHAFAAPYRVPSAFGLCERILHLIRDA